MAKMDKELLAIAAIERALAALEPEAAYRVLAYASQRAAERRFTTMQGAIEKARDLVPGDYVGLSSQGLRG